MAKLELQHCIQHGLSYKITFVMSSWMLSKAKAPEASCIAINKMKNCIKTHIVRTTRDCCRESNLTPTHVHLYDWVQHFCLDLIWLISSFFMLLRSQTSSTKRRGAAFPGLMGAFCSPGRHLQQTPKPCQTPPEVRAHKVVLRILQPPPPSCLNLLLICWSCSPQAFRSQKA